MRHIRVAFPGMMGMSLFLLMVGAFPARAADPVKRPSVLVVLSAAETGHAWDANLERLGFDVDVLTAPAKLDWEQLRQYHLLCIQDMLITPHPTWFGASREKALELAGLVQRYLAEGGGVFLFGTRYGSEEGAGTHGLFLDAVLKPLGAAVPFELVTDPRHAYQQPARVRAKYGWTGDITATPLTAGVKTVYYPVYHLMYGATTSPLQLSPEWQVLVRTADTAVSLKAIQVSQNIVKFEDNSPGTFRGTIPLLATRQVGKGRVVLTGISHHHGLLWDGYAAAEDICLSRGDGVVPSDLRALYANLFRWLAEPALTSTTLGGWKPSGLAPDLTGGLGSTRPINWTGAAQPGEQPRYFPGVIGAHTAAGGGSGTVAEWVAAAKAAGLRWLAFTEDFTRMTPDSWAKLLQACRVASDTEFLAVPGFEITDVGNNRWVQFRPDLTLPLPLVLTADGKKLRDSQNFMFTVGAPPTGPMTIHANGQPAHAYRFLNIFSVFTAERNRTIDQALDGYLVKQEQEDEVEPIAVNLLYAPAELAASRDWYQTRIRAESLDGVKGWASAPCWRAETSYVSNGPEITCWAGTNLTRATLGNYYVAGGERWRITLTARAAAGLKEIRIYDGTELYARYLPTTTPCTLAFDGLHDKSHRFVAVIEDRQGHQAVSNCLLVADFQGRLQMCSDRNNTMPNCITTGANGKAFWYMPATMIDTGRWPKQMVYPAVSAGEVQLPGVDGGILGELFDTDFQIHLEGWTRQGDPFSRLGSVQAGKHVIIQYWRMDDEFLPMQGNGRAVLNVTPYMPFKPNDTFQAEVREVAFVRRPGDLNLVMTEGRIRFKRDIAFSQETPSLQICCIAPEPRPGEFDCYALRLGNGAVQAGKLPPQTKPLVINTEAPAGSYYCAFPKLSGNMGFMTIDDGYRIRVSAQQNFVRAYLDLQQPGRKFKAGQELTYRFICMLGDYDGPADNREFEWARQSLGLTGPPAYTITATQGKVLGTRFLVDIDTDQGGYSGTFAKTTDRRLPMRVPVTVRGLNPRWSAAVYDRVRKELIPFGIGTDGLGITTLDLDQGSADVYIGSLATCDRPELRLTVVEDSPATITVTVQNPTNAPVTTMVTRGTGYTRVPAFQRQVAVPAGGSTSFTVLNPTQ